MYLSDYRLFHFLILGIWMYFILIKFLEDTFLERKEEEEIYVYLFLNNL